MAASGGTCTAVKVQPACDTIEIISEPAQFLALEAEWSGLFERCARPHHFFQCHAWNRYWCKHFLAEPDAKSGQELFIVCGRKDGRLAALWPLVKKRCGGLVVLEWMGDPVSQYGDILIDSDIDASAWCGQVLALISERNHADTLMLRKVREDASIAPLLRESGLCIRSQHAPFLDLASADDYDAYAQRYAGKLRKNRRRHRRRLAQLGEISFDYLRPSAKSAAITGQIMRLKRIWADGKGVVSRSIGNPNVERFFMDIATTSGSDLGCSVSALYLDGGLIAGALGFECKNGHLVHLCTYDNDYSSVSPGNLQCEDTLRACFDEGIASYDRLAPCDRNKLAWSDDMVAVNCYVLPLNLKGRLYARLAGISLPVRTKAAYAKLPERVRIMVAPLINKLARRLG